MQKALVGMVLLGVVAGLAWPSGEAASDAAGSQAAPLPVDAAEPFSSIAPPRTHLRRGDNGHFYVDAEVNSRGPIRFVVDTGASAVALTEEDARRIGLSFDPSEFNVIGQGASGQVRGKAITIDSVSIEGKKVHNVRGAIIQGGTISLLGQSYLAALTSVEMSRDTMTLR